MSQLDDQIRDHAQAMANQAQAIADGTIKAGVHSAAIRLLENAKTLEKWALLKRVDKEA